MSDIQDLISRLHYADVSNFQSACDDAVKLLERLRAGFVMPEGSCASAWGGRETGPCIYTADQLREAYAAGAAAQLNAEPAGSLDPLTNIAYSIGEAFCSPEELVPLYAKKEMP